METGAVIIAGLLIGLAIGGIWLIGGAVYNYQMGYNFQQAVKSDFDLADQASSASQKSFYFDKFVEDLRVQGLTHGDTAIYYPTVNSRLEHLFNNTLSLQDSLHGAVEACKAGRTLDCNTAMQQITLQEFCWFPIDAFKSGYMLQHGAWGAANWTPQDQAYRCSTKSSSYT